MNSIELALLQGQLERAAKWNTKLLEVIDPPGPGSIFTLADIHTMHSAQNLLVTKIERVEELINQAQINERKQLESLQGGHVNGSS